MARQGALKVFRTPIGFHDAYVAATSRKAALQAWGAAKDLFASGSAELVTDPALTKAPLASPGEVIRLPRGTVDEHLRAAGRGRARQGTARAGRAAAGAKDRPAPEPGAAPEERPGRPTKPKPRPSRSRVDRAEAEIRSFEAKAAGERAELDRREAELLKQRKALNARHSREAERLDARLERARDSYEAAMERWRAD